LGCGSALAVVFFVTNWHEFCRLLNTGAKTQVTNPQKQVVNAPVGAKTQRKNFVRLRLDKEDWDFDATGKCAELQPAATSFQQPARRTQSTRKIIFINR